MPLGTFLNAGTASQLRGLLWLSLSDTGQIGSKTSTSDSGGGATESWSFGASVANRGTFEVTAVRVRTASPAQFFEAVQVS
jgi:hypothetical protein